MCPRPWPRREPRCLPQRDVVRMWRYKSLRLLSRHASGPKRLWLMMRHVGLCVWLACMRAGKEVLHAFVQTRESGMVSLV